MTPLFRFVQAWYDMGLGKLRTLHILRQMLLSWQETGAWRPKRAQLPTSTSTS